VHKLALMLLLLAGKAGFAQKSVVWSQYYYLYAKRAVSIVPAILYEGHGNSHYMVRYNFEADQTVSLTAGKTFTGKEGEPVFSPSIGLLAGGASGLSVNLQTALEKGAFFCSTEPLYCYFFSGSGQYIYNWAEAGVQAGAHFFAGAALQSTKEQGIKGWDQQPGVFAGCTIGNLEVPFYLFRSAASGLYMVVGLQWKLSRAQNR
jgi:hypothetical protein